MHQRKVDKALDMKNDVWETVGAGAKDISEWDPLADIDRVRYRDGIAIIGPVVFSSVTCCDGRRTVTQKQQVQQPSTNQFFVVFHFLNSELP